MTKNRAFPYPAVLVLFALLAVAFASDCLAQSRTGPEQEQREPGLLRREYLHFKAYPHLDMAGRMVEQGRRAEAVKELDTYLDLVPDDQDARLMRLRLLNALDRHEAATEDARRLLGANPDHAEARLLLAMSLERLGDLDAARREYERAASTPGLDRDGRRLALFSAAELGRTQGLVEESERRLLALVEQDPADKEALRSLIELYRAMHRPELALTRAQALERLDPSPETRMVVDDLLKASGQFAEAEARLTARLNADPGDLSALRALSDLFVVAGQDVKALDAIRRLTQVEPTPENRERMAVLLVKNREGREAASIYAELAEQAEPGETRGRLLLAQGNALAAAGLSSQAAAAYLRAADETGKPEPLLAAALSQQQGGDVVAAAATIARAVALSDDASVHLQAGYIHILADQRGPAIDHFRSAISLGLAPEREQQARLAVSEALSAEGLHAQALDELRAARALGANGIPPLAEALLLERTGDIPGALAELQNVLSRPGLSPAQAALAHEHMGHLLVKQGRQAEAAKHFILAARIHPDDARPRLFMAATAAVQAGETAMARDLFEEYLDQGGEPGRISSAWASLGHLRARERDWASAEAAFVEALSAPDLDPRARPGLLLGLMETRIERHDHVAVIATGESLLALPDLPPEMAAQASLRVGQALARLGRDEEALQALRRSVVLDGGDPNAWRGIALITYNLRRFDEAVLAYSRALEQEDSLDARLGLGRSQAELGRPGLAVHHYLLAGPRIETLPRNEQRLYWAELGFFLDTALQFDQAAEAYGKALALGYDDETAFRLGRALRLAGRIDDAAGHIDPLDPLDPASPAARPDLAPLVLAEKAALAGAKEMHEDEARYLEEAVSRQADPELFHRLARAYEKHPRPRLDEAIAAYGRALELSETPRNHSDMGYALYRAGYFREAAQAFDSALMLEPDYLNLWQDAAYAWYRAGENETALTRFKTAIDTAPKKPVRDDAERLELERDIYGLRQEVAKLEKTFTATAFMTFHSGESGGAGTGGSEVVRSNSGIEAAFIPPVIGLRDDRLFQVLARVVWNLEKDSLSMDDRSMQGAIGLRYKPLREYNVHLGVERLFKIGRRAEDNWLLRVLGSVADGTDVRLKEPLYNYTLLYVEGAHYTDKPSRSMFYGEARQGLTLNHDDRFFFRPHVFAAARVWSPDRDKSSLYEAGPGLTFSWLFNETAYSAPRSSVEVTAQYRIGQLYNRLGSAKKSDGVFVTTVLTY
ncbi:putative bacteriophage N4 adsorption protein A [Alkalidesulfovibrio alkalitolerans DSM 16529]|uniref:Putative bacteriophage N4 adsorption protein A n=1 Tax=Alkalidesulfovibrio alkalitolerans DSM 16529 TaxID=1121439 RepID=S7T926_9BACT|nr:tetratricopeptide repeat protein [Alkalidesulfovibrio alkalitolerans]EPR33035.1 putative bacteriophage N4 adsorption protein A [Alkalidesulfovibrio alkalitolerans DSM 16529]